MPEEPEIELAFEGELPLFEANGRPNGFTTWSARHLADYLGYSDFKSLKPAINRAQQTLLSLEIDLAEHFRQEKTVGEKGGAQMDLRLSRFACYLVAMNGDPKKRQVAKAQAYFARFNEECQRFLDDAGQIERVLIRDDISDHEKTLSSTAKAAGVKEFALFQNAGYRGLYNMNLSELKKLKRIPKSRSPLDFMGKDELAANLFRLTQTEAKMRRDRVTGQRSAETTAEGVGRQVRQTMHEISGQRPEALPVEEDIREVRLGLKNSSEILKHTKASDLESKKELLPEEFLEAPDESESPE